MSILQKSTSHSQTDRRVRLSGSLCLEGSDHSRTLNRLFSFPRGAWPLIRGNSRSIPGTHRLLPVLSRPVGESRGHVTSYGPKLSMASPIQLHQGGGWRWLGRRLRSRRWRGCWWHPRLIVIIRIIRIIMIAQAPRINSVPGIIRAVVIQIHPRFVPHRINLEPGTATNYC
jgi:hypothetical protein